MKTGGLIVYEGPSMLDGSPIVGIVTLKSNNPKTGNMAQLWILPNMHPVEALRNGQDASVCGDCKHRPILHEEGGEDIRCYVNIMGPSAVYRAYVAGKYAQGTVETVREALTGRSLRLGAWGDPAALPIDIVQALTSYVRNWTGYTHQWTKVDAGWKAFVMASADTVDEFKAAKALGYRTFRVRPVNGGTLPGEITCPASKEMGYRTTCEKCHLCDGAKDGDRRKDIAIDLH